MIQFFKKDKDGKRISCIVTSYAGVRGHGEAIASQEDTPNVEKGLLIAKLRALIDLKNKDVAWLHNNVLMCEIATVEGVKGANELIRIYADFKKRLKKARALRRDLERQLQLAYDVTDETEVHKMLYPKGEKMKAYTFENEDNF